MTDGIFQTVNGQLEHGEYFPDHIDASGIGPFRRHLGVDPDGVGEGVGNKLQSFMAGACGPFLDMDTPVGRHQFIGGHAGISHDDHAGFRIPTKRGPTRCVVRV